MTPVSGGRRGVYNSTWKICWILSKAFRIKTPRAQVEIQWGQNSILQRLAMHSIEWNWWSVLNIVLKFEMYISYKKLDNYAYFDTWIKFDFFILISSQLCRDTIWIFPSGELKC